MITRLLRARGCDELTALWMIKSRIHTIESFTRYASQAPMLLVPAMMRGDCRRDEGKPANES